MAFDPTRPYSNCFGEGPAVYYQNGRYYAGDGTEVYKDKPAAAVSTEQAGEPPKPNGTGEIVNALEALAKQPTFAVKKVFISAGGPPSMAIGQGAKQRMLDWLKAQASA